MSNRSRAALFVCMTGLAIVPVACSETESPTSPSTTAGSLAPRTMPVAPRPTLPPRPAAEMFLSYASTPGHGVGRGRSQQFTSDAARFEAKACENRIVRVQVWAGTSTVWNLAFAAPRGRELAGGTFEGTRDFLDSVPSQPSLYVGGDGRACTNSVGSFRVTEAVFSGSGAVERFHATFEHYCRGLSPLLIGEIQLTAPPKLEITWPC
jgi:hypothetical protein